MTIVTSTHLRQNLAAVLDEVIAGRAPVIVTRQNAAPVVMLPLDEWEGMEETLHLLRSPRNAEALLASIAQANAGNLEDHELIE